MARAISAAIAVAVLSSASPAVAMTAAAPTGSSRIIAHLRGAHDAQQVITVIAAGYGDTSATLRVLRRTPNGWRRVFGPWHAWIGLNGFAPPGQKREGDDRAPSGSFRLKSMFGVYPDPGVRFRYRRARTTSYWDDDSTSAHYNRWVDSRNGYPGRNPEPMHVSPPYNYGVVIGYNWSQTPYLGSAIFLHVTHHSPTHGCVSIGQQRLVRVMRWLRPGLKPRIIMGTRATVTR